VYLTTDWNLAYESVKRLVQLAPNILVPGHGTAMQGEELKKGLQKLVSNWNEVAVPSHGKWVMDSD